MLKKLLSALPALNVTANLIFIVFYIFVRLDIFPEDIFTVWIFTMIFSGVTVLLFVISTIYLWVKNKKPPTAFSYILSYFFTALWLFFVGYLFYGVYTFGF